MARPFVSVLIDTYNHERFIEQAIVSVLEQDFPPSDREILVVDDGSTDRTAAVVRKFAPCVRYLRKANGGQASAFNVGIPETRGEIVAFLDGDDWWAPGKLRTVLDVFEKNPGVGAVGHGLFQVDAEGKLLSTVLPEKTSRLDLRTLEGASLFGHLKGFLGTSKVAMRRKVLDKALPLPESIVVEADEFLWTIAVAVADAIVLDQPLFYYRFHGGNLFMMSSFDASRLRRKQRSLAELLRHLPGRLKALGVEPDVARLALEPLRVESEHHRLALDGGRPWEMFRAERDAYRLAYRNVTWSYRLFKGIVLGLTLMMPPRRFCQLKRWYAAKDLSKLRRIVGEPVPAAPVLKRG